MLRFPTTRLLTLLAATTVLGSLALPALADDRRFTYSYETTTAPKGEIEVETWATYKHRAGEGKDLDRFDFRHELEFGATDRLQLSIYVANWSYNSSDVEHKARYQDSGFEAIYQLTNPTTSFLGTALYGEVLLGEEHLKLEGKLLFQKNFGPLVAVYNVGLEAEWEGEEFGDYEETVGEFYQSAGLSYEVTKNFFIGAEIIHEFEMEEWGDSGDAAVYAGPNMSFRAGRVFATLTGMFQLTDVEEEPDVQARLVVGVNF